ncbi:MAG: hypothetical protein V3S83_12285 [Gemmatimonadota bacterium]
MSSDNNTGHVPQSEATGKGKNPAARGDRPHAMPIVKVGPAGGAKRLNVKPSPAKKG